MPKTLYACEKCNKSYIVKKNAIECEINHELEEVECCYSCALVIPDYDEVYTCELLKTTIKLHNKCKHYARHKDFFQDE